MNFLRKKVIIQWNAWKKDLLLLANNLIEKTPETRNAKKHHQSLIREKKKNTKLVKQSEIITYQSKTFENPNIVYTKSVMSVITKHPKPCIN